MARNCSAALYKLQEVFMVVVQTALELNQLSAVRTERSKI
jgi:hypothetical protein